MAAGFMIWITNLESQNAHQFSVKSARQYGQKCVMGSRRLDPALAALAALANEPNVLVIVTTGGRSLDAIPGLVPGNTRLATYLPFEWLLPKVGVLVTNGGYGSVNQAPSFGVPLVTAGLTEDKADVNVRVAWSGVGINLATNSPTPQALGKAVRAVLENPIYRSRVSSMAEEYRRIDTRSEIMRILGQVSGVPAGC